MGIVILVLITFVAGGSVGFMIGFSRALRESAKKIHGTHRPLLGWLIFGLGCSLLVIGLISSLYTWRFTRDAEHASGVVVEMRPHLDKDNGDVSYAPTFRFEDSSGIHHTVSSSFFSSPPEFHVNNSVDVLYRRNDPENARINSYWQLWGIPSLTGIIGSVELPVGLVVICWPAIVARFRSKIAPKIA